MLSVPCRRREAGSAHPGRKIAKMAVTEPRPASATHEVFNQSGPLTPYNPFEADRVLAEALRREGADWAEEEARELGAICGRPDVVAKGAQANENPPRLRTHDRFGHRIDEVEFHPAWHELMRIGVGHGLHAAPWREPRRARTSPGPPSSSFCPQAEAGLGCPISMTYSAVPALRAPAGAGGRVGAALRSPAPTTARAGPGSREDGRRCAGMAMTEKQGGSDVRANTTRPAAERRRARRRVRITGHKWFCSAPMCDAFLVLAQAAGGLSCFLLPRFTPDGDAQPLHIQRLKDKLGNRSNASSEVEFRRRLGAHGGRGGARRARRSSRWSTTPGWTA